MLIALVLCFAPASIHAQITPTPTDEAAADPQEGVQGATYSTTNVRNAPDARAGIIERVPSGETVQIAGRDSTGQWLYIAFGEIVGWLPAVAITVELADGSLFDPLSLPIVDPQPGDTLPSQPNGPQIIAYGRVNVRSAPTIDSPLVIQLDSGDTAPVIARNNALNDWLLVETEVGEGWVAYFTVRVEGGLVNLPILVPDGGSGALIPPATVVRTRFNARLHTVATLESPITVIVPFDVEVTPIARSADGNWLFVGYQGATGWGAASLFEMDDEAIDALPLFVALPTATTRPSLGATATTATPTPTFIPQAQG